MDMIRGYFMDFIKKNFQVLALGLLVLVFGINIATTVITAINPRLANMSQDVIEAIIGDVVDEKIEPVAQTVEEIRQFVAFSNNYSVLLIATEVNELRTPQAVHERVDFLESNSWNAQIAAMRFISQNKESQNALKELVPNPAVYEAILTRILNY